MIDSGDNGDFCVYVFNENGEYIFKLIEMLEFGYLFYIVFYWLSEYIVVVGFCL